jgi:hypothetical protein
MKPVPLTSDQRKTRREISRLVRTLRQHYQAGAASENTWPLLQKAGELSHGLHISLKATGWEPKHHRHMLQNRGVSPDEPEFYQHFHPIEGLLKFLRNPAANDEPADLTLGTSFTFRVFSWRWGHPDSYHLKRTEKELPPSTVDWPC